MCTYLIRHKVSVQILQASYQVLTYPIQTDPPEKYYQHVYLTTKYNKLVNFPVYRFCNILHDRIVYQGSGLRSFSDPDEKQILLGWQSKNHLSLYIWWPNLKLSHFLEFLDNGGTHEQGQINWPFRKSKQYKEILFVLKSKVKIIVTFSIIITEGTKFWHTNPKTVGKKTIKLKIISDQYICLSQENLYWKKYFSKVLVCVEFSPTFLVKSLNILMDTQLYTSYL